MDYYQADDGYDHRPIEMGGLTVIYVAKEDLANLDYLAACDPEAALVEVANPVNVSNKTYPKPWLYRDCNDVLYIIDVSNNSIPLVGSFSPTIEVTSEKIRLRYGHLLRSYIVNGKSAARLFWRTIEGQNTTFTIFLNEGTFSHMASFESSPMLESLLGEIVFYHFIGIDLTINRGS